MKTKTKELIIIIISLLFIIAPVIFMFNYYYYIDIINQCYIRIDRESNLTRESMDYAKKNSKDDYKLICKNLSKIVETDCFSSDPHLEEGLGAYKPGCYLRGTKIAYLHPTSSLQGNVESLARYAKYSEEYWGSTDNILIRFINLFDKR